MVQNEWAIGVALAAFASVISNVGLNLQKWNHTKNNRRLEEERSVIRSRVAYGGVSGSPSRGTAAVNGLLADAGADDGGAAAPPAVEEEEAEDGAPRVAEEEEPVLPNYAGQRLWQIGLALVILGSLCDFAALAFAPQSVVAPLGALTLVSNIWIAPWLLGEKRTRSDVAATAFIVCGAATSVAFAAHDEPDYTLDQLLDLYQRVRFAVYASVVVVTVVLLHSSVAALDIMRDRWLVDPAHPDVAAYPSRIAVHRFNYSALAGITGAQSVLFSKSAAVMLVAAITGRGLFFGYYESYLILLGLGGSIFLQIKWLNGALIAFDALYVVPVFQTFWILVSVIGGLVFYGEYADVFSGHGLSPVMFPVGVLVTLGGVYFLSGRADKGVVDPDSSESALLGSRRASHSSEAGASPPLLPAAGPGAGRSSPLVIYVRPADAALRSANPWSYTTMRPTPSPGTAGSGGSGHAPRAAASYGGRRASTTELVETPTRGAPRRIEPQL